MKRKVHWTIVFLFLPLQFVSAQSWENEYQQYINMDDIESSTWEETSELLSELRRLFYGQDVQLMMNKLKQHGTL